MENEDTTVNQPEELIKEDELKETQEEAEISLTPEETATIEDGAVGRATRRPEPPKPKPKPKPKPRPKPAERPPEMRPPEPTPPKPSSKPTERTITREDVDNFLRNERIEKAKKNQAKFSKLFSTAI